MKPVNSRAIAVATFGFAFPRATLLRKRDVSRRLRFPRDVTDGFRQGFLSVQHLSPDPRHALIRPRRFGEQPARVRIARFGDPPAADAGWVHSSTPTARGRETPWAAGDGRSVGCADFDDETDGRDK
jgi:hypothetical protein